MTLRVALDRTDTHEPLGEGPATATCDRIPYHLPPPPTPSPFLRIDGYDILDRLGAGGMGVVFKARHRRLNRVVALKVLAWGSLADLESHRRFQTEAQAVARLQHPNIIQVFDVGSFAEGPDDPRARPYLSLEYVDGGSLYKQTLAPQDPWHSARLIEKVARAVHAAHQVGVIHRDLKPANVLLTADGEPKIADFGLAKQLDARRDEHGGVLTQDGTAVGTPEYMAPEQVDGLPAAPAIDVYALGVMLYELLTARQPFKGVTVLETMMLVKYQEPIPPSRLRPTLPKDLETICLKCLAKSPAARYATAEALADDLARWLSGRPIMARPVSGVERVGRWARRNPSLATLSLIAVGLAVAGVSGVMWKWLEAERNYGRALENEREALARREAERWELYRASVAVADADLRTNTLSSTCDTLMRAPVEHRNWEWRYCRRQLDTAVRVLEVAGGEIENAELLAGGRAVVWQKVGVSVWDLQGRRRIVETAPPGVVTSADGRRMGWAADGRVYLRPTDGDGSEVTVSDPDGPIDRFTLCADGTRVMTIREGCTRVWDALTGSPVGVARRFRGNVGTVGFSRTGRLAGVHEFDAGGVVLWEVETGRVLKVFEEVRNLMTIEFSPDERRLLMNLYYPSNRVVAWDTSTRQHIYTLSGHTNNVLCIAHSPDSRVLATACRDKTVRLWDATDGRLRAVLRGHTGAVNFAAFSGDGRRLVTAADDRTVRTWDVETGVVIGTYRGHEKDVVRAGFVDGGDGVASISRDGTIRYWDARPGSATGVRTGHTGFVYGVAFHPDGRHAVSASWDGSAVVWDEAGQAVRRLEHPKGERVVSVAVHPGGKWVATSCWSQNTYLWDFASGKLVRKWEVNGEYWKTGRVAFHPTESLLASVGGCGSVRLYDPATGERVRELTLDVDAIRDVAFSPDGKWLAAAGDADKTVHLWEVAGFKKAAEFQRHTDAAYALAFAPDGRTLASGGLDGNIHLWDLATRRWAGELKGGLKVYSLAFTPDGTRLASGGAANTVKVWDLARREAVLELDGHTDYVHALAFSPNGHRLLTASGDLTLRHWDATPVGE